MRISYAMAKVSLGFNKDGNDYFEAVSGYVVAMYIKRKCKHACDFYKLCCHLIKLQIDCLQSCSNVRRFKTEAC